MIFQIPYPSTVKEPDGFSRVVDEDLDVLREFREVHLKIKKIKILEEIK